MEFLVLGPIEVRSAGSPIHLGGVKQRSILALLIANQGHVVSTDRIVTDIYGEDAAPGARRSVQSIVSLIRRDLGDVIVGSGDGYVFEASQEAVDATRFEYGAAAGLAALDDDPGLASQLLGDVLGLWRGDPYADVDGRAVFEPEIARLSELRLVALEARVEADLGCGRHREVVGELEALTLEFPLRERLRGLWMLALYRCGRQADALGTYQQLRTNLGEELGLERSTELRVLEEKILLQDPELDLVSPVPHNLPAQLTSFVGRDLELIEVGELLTETRLVTLTGAGGSGKTRLAVELARRMLDDYPDGVWLVDFRGVDAGGVASLIVSTLRVVTSGDRPMVAQLVDALWSRRLLLVLDNCEHVLDGVAPLVEQLLHRDGTVRVLATSREPLGVPGESLLLVRSLPVPESASVDELAACEAAVLLTDRARSASPNFTLEEQVESVFGICRTVEGLPLGLELAAARLRILSPEELADRLDDQLGMLRTTLKAGDLRHATMEATIRWSWDLLDDAEQTLFARLSVFHGTWSLDAAEPVCGFDPIGDGRVVDVVGSLVDKSLVVVDGVVRRSTRYRLLEPLRQFAARQLDDQATDQLRSRVIDYWSTVLTGSYEPEDRFAWRDHERANTLEVDQANLTAAVDWALASDRFEDAMRIFASPYGDLLMLQGSGFESASRWMDSALEHRRTISNGVLLTALEAAGSIAAAAGRHAVTLDYAQPAIEISRTSEERHCFELAAATATIMLEGHSEATNAVFDRVATEARSPDMRASALLAQSLNDTPKRAWRLTQQAMELSDSPCLWDQGYTNIVIADAAAEAGHYDVAKQMLGRTLNLSRRIGSRILECRAAVHLAWVYSARGRLDEASSLLSEAVPIARHILGLAGFSVDVLECAARVARLEGDLDKARNHIKEALNANRSFRDWGTMPARVESALVARDCGDLSQAQDLLNDAFRRLEDMDHADFGPLLRAWVRTAQVSVELRRGDSARALEDLRRLLADPHRLAHLEALEAVDLAAIACAQQGNAAVAARLKGAVDRERDDCGLVIPPPDEAVREIAMEYAQSVFDGDWEAAVVRGRAMTLDEAIELAKVEASFVGETRTGVRPEDT